MQGCYPLRHILLSPVGDHGKESGFLHVQVSPREHTCTELLIGSAPHSLQPNFFGYLHPDDAAIQLGNNLPIIPAYGGKNEVRMRLDSVCKDSARALPSVLFPLPLSPHIMMPFFMRFLRKKARLSGA